MQHFQEFPLSQRACVVTSPNWAETTCRYLPPRCVEPSTAKRAFTARTVGSFW